MLTRAQRSTTEPHRRTASSTRFDGERGSVIMSVLVLMVIGLLAATLFTYSQASARASMRQELQRTVIDGLDAGMANAISRIQLGETASFTGSGTIDDVAFTYTATKESTLRWTVTATATRSTAPLGTIRRAAEATVTGSYRGASPYALFASNALTITNDNFAVSEPIGSNGVVDVAGNARALAIHTFTPSGSCVGCTNATSQSPTWPTPQPATPTTSRACPQATLTESNGRRSRVYGFLGNVNGQNGRPFRCTLRTDNTVFGHYPTIIYETINVINPPLVIHVDSQVTLWFLRANVNPGGDPRDFVVEAVGGPTDGGGYEYGRFWDDGTRLTGIIDAPSRQLTVDTALDITGRMTVGSLTFSSSSLQVTADSRVVDASIDWTASSWHAIAP